MFDPPRSIVLGSRSPRRLELLAQIVPPSSIEVLPPLLSREAGFEGLHEWAPVEARLVEISLAKFRDVVGQLRSRGSKSGPVVITADTVIVAGGKSTGITVLGQPPEGFSWRAVVGRWFREHYSGTTHTVATALCVGTADDDPPLSRVERSEVTMRADVDRWLEWYLETQEPRGKAGGYAIQGAGDIFITRVDGSISNVIGLPLAALIELLEKVAGERSK